MKLLSIRTPILMNYTETNSLGKLTCNKSEAIVIFVSSKVAQVSKRQSKFVADDILKFFIFLIK